MGHILGQAATTFLHLPTTAGGNRRRHGFFILLSTISMPFQLIAPLYPGAPPSPVTHTERERYTSEKSSQTDMEEEEVGGTLLLFVVKIRLRCRRRVGAFFSSCVVTPGEDVMGGIFAVVVHTPMLRPQLSSQQTTINHNQHNKYRESEGKTLWSTHGVWGGAPLTGYGAEPH